VYLGPRAREPCAQIQIPPLRWPPVAELSLDNSDLVSSRILLDESEFTDLN
jgi:hypothetical protein